jgi:hypothetical protein
MNMCRYVYLCTHVSIWSCFPHVSIWMLLVVYEWAMWAYECCSYVSIWWAWAMWAYECGSYVSIWACSLMWAYEWGALESRPHRAGVGGEEEKTAWKHFKTPKNKVACMCRCRCRCRCICICICIGVLSPARGECAELRAGGWVVWSGWCASSCVQAAWEKNEKNNLASQWRGERQTLFESILKTTKKTQS